MPTPRKRKAQRRKAQRGTTDQPSKAGDAAFVSAGRSRNIPNMSAITTTLSAVPQHFRTTLVWSYLLNGSSTSSYAESVIILNSPYDPDNAFGGTQPAGFSKLMAFYSKCFTLAARARVQGVFTGANSVPPNTFASEVGLFISTNSTSIGSMTAGMESGLATTRIIGDNPDHFDLSLGCDIGLFLDKPDVMDDPQLFCTSSANPGQLVCLHFANVNYSAASSNVIVSRVTVQFDVVFTDPIPFT